MGQHFEATEFPPPPAFEALKGCLAAQKVSLGTLVSCPVELCQARYVSHPSERDNSNAVIRHYCQSTKVWEAQNEGWRKEIAAIQAAQELLRQTTEISASPIVEVPLELPAADEMPPADPVGESISQPNQATLQQP